MSLAIHLEFDLVDAMEKNWRLMNLNSRGNCGRDHEESSRMAVVTDVGNCYEIIVDKLFRVSISSTT